MVTEKTCHTKTAWLVRDGKDVRGHSLMRQLSTSPINVFWKEELSASESSRGSDGGRRKDPAIPKPKRAKTKGENNTAFESFSVHPAK